MFKCSKCKQQKSQDAFHIDNRLKRGFTYQCKLCRCTSSNTWAATDQGKEKHRKSQLRYHNRNRIKVMLDNAKRRAKQNNVPFTLKKEDISIPDLCPVLAIPLLIGVARYVR